MIKNNFQIKYLNLQRRELEPGHKEVIHSAPCYLCHVCSKTWFPKSPSTKFSSQRKSKENEQEPTSLRTYRISMNRVPKGFSWISIPDSYQSKTGSGFPRKPRNLMKNTPIQEMQISPKFSRIPIDGQCLINLNPWFPRQIRDLIEEPPLESYESHESSKKISTDSKKMKWLSSEIIVLPFDRFDCERNNRNIEIWAKGGEIWSCEEDPFRWLACFDPSSKIRSTAKTRRQFLGCSKEFKRTRWNSVRRYL